MNTHPSTNLLRGAAFVAGVALVAGSIQSAEPMPAPATGKASAAQPVFQVTLPGDALARSADPTQPTAAQVAYFAATSHEAVITNELRQVVVALRTFQSDRATERNAILLSVSKTTNELGTVGLQARLIDCHTSAVYFRILANPVANMSTRLRVEPANHPGLDWDRAGNENWIAMTSRSSRSILTNLQARLVSPRPLPPEIGLDELIAQLAPPFTFVEENNRELDWLRRRVHQELRREAGSFPINIEQAIPLRGDGSGVEKTP